MKKSALLFLVFAFSSVSAFPQVNEILKRMDTHQKALKTLGADIKITKFSIESGGTYTKEGVLKFVPSKETALKIDSTKPALESFLTLKNQYLIYLPDLKMAYSGMTTDSQKNTFMIFSVLSNKNLKADYNIVYTGQEKVNGTIPAFHLELTPKTTQNYQTIELWVDGNGMPLQSKIIENNGDWTNVFLENLRKNIVINVSEFQIKLPKGTKLIKN